MMFHVKHRSGTLSDRSDGRTGIQVAGMVLMAQPLIAQLLRALPEGVSRETIQLSDAPRRPLLFVPDGSAHRVELAAHPFGQGQAGGEAR